MPLADNFTHIVHKKLYKSYVALKQEFIAGVLPIEFTFDVNLRTDGFA